MLQLWENKLLQSKAVEGFHTEEQAALQAAQQQQQQQQQVQPVQQVQQVTQQAQAQQVILPPQQQQGWFLKRTIRHTYTKKKNIKHLWMPQLHITEILQNNLCTALNICVLNSLITEVDIQNF